MQGLTGTEYRDSSIVEPEFGEEWLYKVQLIALHVIMLNWLVASSPCTNSACVEQKERLNL
jgi:hypothetical protein